ncbi:MAG: EAL domain-containing protein [Lachnospiraceae bacterium]|nr:EAL domain-containing protein [Lachnospiraceae bacterium]
MDELRYQIDLLNAMNQKLSRNEKAYRAILDTSSNAFLYYSFEDDRLEVIGNWSFFFDFSIKEVKDVTQILECVEEKYVLPLREIAYLEKTGIEFAIQEAMLTESKKWIEFEVTVNYNELKQPLEKILCVRDITKFKMQNDELAYMAYYDILTGLYNRNYFVRVLGEWLRKAEATKDVVAVMFIDIDDFRKINDSLGIIAGDEVVQLFGQQLKEFESDKVIVSHFNSDLYCIAIYAPYGNRSVEFIYNSICDNLRKPIRLIGQEEMNLSVSVGVAEYPEAAGTALELINCAEIVMFRAKNQGKGTIQYFDAKILNEFLENVTIENKLKDAVYNENFSLYFQPQFETSTKTLRGVEALIRWKDDKGSFISPSVFIPIAERNGAIVPIGNWVVEESLKAYAAWRNKYNYPLVMSINISAIQYKRPDFVANLMRLLEEYDIQPSQVELEITESVLIDDFARIIDKMRVLRNYGLRVSLDDFGTGFSSLSYLKNLPIDTLKIDKSFIDTVVCDNSTKVITESIILMAKKLNFETVAEGVETEEQYEYLKQIKCDTIQGYLFGKPSSFEEIEQLLEKVE